MQIDYLNCPPARKHCHAFWLGYWVCVSQIPSLQIALRREEKRTSIQFIIIWSSKASNSVLFPWDSNCVLWSVVSGRSPRFSQWLDRRLLGASEPLFMVSPAGRAHKPRWRKHFQVSIPSKHNAEPLSTQVPAHGTFIWQEGPPKKYVKVCRSCIGTGPPFTRIIK